MKYVLPVILVCLALPALAGDNIVIKDNGKTYIAGIERLEWGKEQELLMRATKTEASAIKAMETTMRIGRESS